MYVYDFVALSRQASGSPLTQRPGHLVRSAPSSLSPPLGCPLPRARFHRDLLALALEPYREVNLTSRLFVFHRKTLCLATWTSDECFRRVQRLFLALDSAAKDLHLEFRTSRKELENSGSSMLRLICATEAAAAEQQQQQPPPSEKIEALCVFRCGERSIAAPHHRVAAVSRPVSSSSSSSSSSFSHTCGHSSLRGSFEKFPLITAVHHCAITHVSNA